MPIRTVNLKPVLRNTSMRARPQTLYKQKTNINGH